MNYLLITEVISYQECLESLLSFTPRLLKRQLIWGIVNWLIFYIKGVFRYKANRINIVEDGGAKDIILMKRFWLRRNRG